MLEHRKNVDRMKVFEIKILIENKKKQRTNLKLLGRLRTMQCGTWCGGSEEERNSSAWLKFVVFLQKCLFRFFFFKIIFCEYKTVLTLTKQKDHIGRRKGETLFSFSLEPIQFESQCS